MGEATDFLANLQKTPIANLLVLAGIIFLVLSLVGKIGAIVSLPAERQKWSALAGAVLLVCGVILSLPSHTSVTAQDQNTLKKPSTAVPQNQNTLKERGSVGPQEQNTVREDNPVGPQDQRALRGRITMALQVGVDQYTAALRSLDLSPMRGYTPNAVRGMARTVDSLKKQGIFTNARLLGGNIDWRNFAFDGTKAEVHVIETWEFTHFSVTTKRCVDRVPAYAIPRCYTLVLLGDNWLISGWRLDDPTQTPPPRLPCLTN